MSTCRARMETQSIHVSHLTFIVETSRPVLEVKAEPFTDVQRRVGENVAALIRDGATLQTGIGGIPEAVLICLQDKHDLGIHTEMCSDGVIDLMESGVHQLESASRCIAARRLRRSFSGPQRLFDFIHENPSFEFRSISYTNDPFVVAQNENMVAINSAIAGGSDGPSVRGLAGNQALQRFRRATGLHSRSGALEGRGPDHCAAIHCVHGSVSRIVPVLEPGAGVVTSRADVHYVVTEHGIAYLHGKILRERAEALIAIADPQFQAGTARFRGARTLPGPQSSAVACEGQSHEERT